MPKTRRTQPSVGQQTASRSGTQTRKDVKSLAREEEKENLGRTTGSRRHPRSGVLGATTTLGVSSAATKPSSKGAGKRKPTQVLKEKKMPLQDITSQFLPAPESANRGVGTEGGEQTLSIQEPYHTPRRPISPLPPSSPPADLVLSPVRPSTLGSNLLDGIDTYVDDQANDILLPDDEHNTENDRQTSSSSDPFGFAALERKLKEERKFVMNTLNPHVYEDDDIYEELQEIPVADTSSPRPVRRIKQSVTRFEEEHQSSENEAIGDALDSLAHPQIFTPPTPRKDKGAHRRLSCEGQDIFSPCSSSLESSPSPTKASVKKRRRDILYGQDTLDITADGETNIAPVKPPSKRQSRLQDDEQHSTITRILRPRRPAVAKKVERNPKPLKSTSGAKSNRKAKLNSPKKAPDASNDNDLEEKWKQEREERVKYFDRLTEYSVEKENVYII